MPEVMISGPEGRLQARYNQAEDIRAPIALILHPHPQHGGTMNNKNRPRALSRLPPAVVLGHPLQLSRGRPLPGGTTTTGRVS